MGSFISPGGLPDALVARCQEHNDKQRKEEGKGAGDMPLAEDDAEVFGRPGEEHLIVSVYQLKYR